MSAKWEVPLSRFLTKDELAALLIKADELKTLGIAKKRPQLVRDWMIINLFIMTGVRRSEAADLRCTDFFLQGRSCLHIRNGKGGKQRYIHLPKGFKKDVAFYLKWKVERGELDGPDAYFLRSERSPKYSGSGLYKRVKRYLPQHRLHDLRHTNASALYEATKSLVLVQRQLGHSSVSTSQVYTGLSLQQCDASVGLLRGLPDHSRARS